MPSERTRQAMLSGMRKTSNGGRAASENGTGRASPRRMSEPSKICCYGYVNRSYQSVRDVLHQRPLELLRQATTSAAERANSLAASLRLGVAGIEIGVGVRIDVRAVREEEGVAGMSPVTRVVLGCGGRKWVVPVPNHVGAALRVAPDGDRDPARARRKLFSASRYRGDRDRCGHGPPDRGSICSQATGRCHRATPPRPSTARVRSRPSRMAPERGRVKSPSPHLLASPLAEIAVRSRRRRALAP